VLFEERSRAVSFGAVAQLYDRVRPSYPPSLVDTLLADGARTVLDVGCGTGIAATLFAARGCDVLGVEIDPRMAELARAKGLEVEVAGFERWEDRGRRFELLISGQAWHWIEPQAGAAKAAAVLREGGRMGAFWNFGDLPPELGARLTPIYQRLAPALERDNVLLGGHNHRGREATAAIAGTGAFEAPEVHRFAWRRRYGRTEWLEHLRSHSDHQALPAARLDELLDEIGAAVDALGGAVELPYTTILVTSRRR
jgi:SAM-dependent methyltransferase